MFFGALLIVPRGIEIKYKTDITLLHCLLIVPRGIEINKVQNYDRDFTITFNRTKRY